MRKMQLLPMTFLLLGLTGLGCELVGEDGGQPNPCSGGHCVEDCSVAEYYVCE